jgi:hypothetical protein
MLRHACIEKADVSKLNDAMKMTAFWDMASCSIAEIDRPFRGTYCLHNQGDEAVRTSETSVCFNETTQCYVAEGCNVHTRRRQNLNITLTLLLCVVFNDSVSTICFDEEGIEGKGGEYNEFSSRMPYPCIWRKTYNLI